MSLTTFDGQPVRKPFSWSYSKLQAFRTCAKKYYHEQVRKDFVEKANEHMLWGNRVHSAMAKRVMHSSPLPAGMEHWEKWAQWALQPAAPVLRAEFRMAVTNKLQPCEYFDKRVDPWFRTVADVLAVDGRTARLIDWKGLALDTLIPTPAGFCTMADLREGDMVFGTDGNVYPVIGKSEVKQLPCYEVVFTSGISVVCDEEHLWQVGDIITPVSCLMGGSKINLPASTVMPDAGQSLDAYVLGIWLAEGKHTSGEITNADPEVWKEIKRRGYAVGDDIGSGKCETRTVFDIRDDLKHYGVLGDKHIPLRYIWAGVEQRRDLIRGIADGDGTVNKLRKQVIIELTNKRLANQTAQVLRSLGERVLVSEVTRSGFGLTVQAWMVSWRPRTFNPFTLPRKRDLVPELGVGREYLEVAYTKKIPPVPTQCISVGSPNSMYLCTEAFIPTHNTGKVKEDSDQLALGAAIVMIYYPEVEDVVSQFVFLKDDVKHEETYHRSGFARIWQRSLPDVIALHTATKSGEFLPSPSGLCLNHCGVTSCAYHGRGNR